MTTHIVANRYAVGQKIGSGGMGDVFRGVDQRTDTPIAIKALKSDLATPEMITRFVREGEALRQLNHPHIVALRDAVQENGEYYLIMELIEGGALDELLRRTPRLPVAQVLNIALDLADALTRAHRLNIVHRDIKPANVLLSADGMPRLSDFGVARVIGSDITEAGILVGTAAYIAPEVLQGDVADSRADIWSFGVMLFEMLAGLHPFKTKDLGSMVLSIISTPLPDLEALRPETPVGLIDLINRMVTKNPAERIPRMRLVGVELEVLLSGETFNAASTNIQNMIPVTEDILQNSQNSRFATPSPVSVRIIRNNLPAQTTPFVGRESELSELQKLMHDSTVRLVTILATGGMGKTRLSLELGGKLLDSAQHDLLFENGIYFVDLAPLVSAENIVHTAAEAVGCVFQQDGRPAQQQLLDYLHEKNALLIMDNFEHVIDGRTLVQDILQAAPLVKIVTTSREKLNLSAETVFILSGMNFPEWETPEDALEYAAVKLFMQSARRVRADFQLSADDLPFVARICRLAQGSPLGILLAAAWLEALSPKEIADEISRSLDFLETQMHDLPERQRSLRAVFEYSWHLLTDAERVLFAQISMFRGGFTREAAQQITGTNLRTLTVMVNKSLLRRDHVSGRYEVHELLRQYAEEKLSEAPNKIAIHDAHSGYYSGLLAQLTPKLKGHGQLEALIAIETDFENIRTAWNWAIQQDNAAAIQAAIEGLYLYLTFRNQFMDGEVLFRSARQHWNADGTTPALLAGQGLVRYPEQPPLEHFRRGLAIAQQHNDPHEIAFCQRLIGHWLSHSEFNQPEGIPLLQASLKGYQALGDRFYAAQVLDDLGWSYLLMSNRADQRVVVKQSLELRREIDDKIGTANSLRNMGGAAGGFYDATGASFKYWQEAKEIAYEMKDRLGIAWNATLQGANLIVRGDFDRAVLLIDEGYPHATDVNDPVVKGFNLVNKGLLLCLRDEDYRNAKTLIEEGYPANSIQDFRLLAAPFGMALVACGLHDIQILQSYVEGRLTTPPFSQLDYQIPTFMPCRFIQLTDEGQYARAAELMSAFESGILSFLGFPFPMEWAKRWGLLNRLRSQLERELGAAAFQAAWDRGAQLGTAELGDELQFLWR